MEPQTTASETLLGHPHHHQNAKYLRGSSLWIKQTTQFSYSVCAGTMQLSTVDRLNWLGVCRLMAKMVKPLSSALFVLQYFVNGVNVCAELSCGRQRFHPERLPLQQEVLHTEVVFSLCIPFYGCIYLYKNSAPLLGIYVSSHSLPAASEYAWLRKRRSLFSQFPPGAPPVTLALFFPS